MSSSKGATQAGGFFSTSNKRSEISEWKELLNSDKEANRKEAVKKIIAAMTVGKDVSMLFPDVVKSIQTNNIELKKLVYLYLMNYAKTQPDLAILAVNTFVQDSRHENALIRGLAVRTMGCIRVNKIVEYLAEPLRRSIKDKDPYVRKTAAVSIAKLFDLDPEMAVDQGFIEALQELLTDENPMVVANAVATLSEISANAPEVMHNFTQKSVKTLLAALNECTEWGQVFILDSLAEYEPKSESEAAQIAERVTPRLQHANSAVVLSAVKVIMKTIMYIHDDATVQAHLKKMSSPLVTLLNAQPEIQYVALRNIDLIIQKYPGILNKDAKMFFCKYNDPIYVKLEKLEIMIKLANEKNVDTVLMEFKEYATEIDVEFVRRSVRAIGRCAIKLERAAQRCIDTLLDLIQTKVNYVVQEAIIVIKDIFRKYPNRYESIIGTLCENLDTLDEPEAKASMIWIIGEYAERIENADELLEVFLDSFHDETAQVQLQLLSAVVKLFLKRPTDTQELVKKVLSMSTDESDNPDLRDRGYMYWRLLSTDAAAAKDVVLAERPTIADDSSNMNEKLLNQLISQIGSLSSIYHKPPEMFVPDYKKRKEEAVRLLQQIREEATNGEEVEVVEREDMIDYGDQLGPNAGLEDDMLGLSITPSAGPNGSSAAAVAGLDDLLGIGTPAPTYPVAAQTVAGFVPQMNVVLDAARGKGMQISGVIRKHQGQIVYDLTFENHGNDIISGIAFKFNKNSFNLAPTGIPQLPPIAPGQSASTLLPLAFNGQFSGVLNTILQVAVKNNVGVSYFQDSIPVVSLFSENGRMDPSAFLGFWQSITSEQQISVARLLSTNIEVLKQRLASTNIYYVEKNEQGAQAYYYFSAALPYNGADVAFMFELCLTQGSQAGSVAIKAADTTLLPNLQQEITAILSSQ